MTRALGLLATAFMMPFSMRLTNFACRVFDSTYSDAPCFLQMVKDTNEDHYKTHPMWRFIEPQTSCNTTDYLKKNESAYIEQRVNYWFTIGCAFVSILVFFFLVYLNKEKAVNLLVLLVLMDRVSQEAQGYVHIVNDMTQANGTILHHVPIWTGATQQNPAEGLKAIGEGNACTLIVANVGYMLLTYFIVKGSRYPATIAMAMFSPVSLISRNFQMKKHNEIHEMGEAAATSLNPLNRWYYECHIRGHHYDGSFCSHVNPGLLFHDPLMHLVGRMLEAGYLQFGTWGFEAVSFGIEVFIFAASGFKIFVFLWFCTKVHTQIEKALSGKAD